MGIKHLVPWRVRNATSVFLEDKVRPRSHRLYKLLKFGRTNLNTRAYWNQTWSTDSEQRNYDQLFKLIVERIPERAKVIDVGCGVGRLSKIIKRERDADLTCLDFSDWACEQLKREGFKTVVSKLPRIPLESATFDVAVATEVLEHLDDPVATLKQMARVVRPGGIVMCSVPNDALHPHVELEHQQAFTEASLRHMLSTFGQDITILSGDLIPGGKTQFLLGVVRIEK